MDGAGEAREDNARLRQSTKAARCDEVLGGNCTSDTLRLSCSGWQTVDGHSSVTIAPAEQAASPLGESLDMRQPCWVRSPPAIRQSAVLAHETINADKQNSLGALHRCPPHH